jgi:hypothetical protein
LSVRNTSHRRTGDLGDVDNARVQLFVPELLIETPRVHPVDRPVQRAKSCLMRQQRHVRYDVHLGDEEVRRDVRSDAPPFAEELLFGNRWIVTAVLPATEARIEYEVFARRVAADEELRPLAAYLVIKCGARPAMASYATRRPLGIGEIVLGVEKWVVREIRPAPTFGLVDGYLVVEQR